MVPPVMRQPGRQKPMLAMPMVRLARPRLPDQAEHLPPVQLDVHSLDDLLPAFLLEALDAKALHGE